VPERPESTGATDMRFPKLKIVGMKKEKRRILALDLGTNTGWATNAALTYASGSREFSGEITGWRYLAFKQWLVTELDRYNIQHVVFEETFSGRNMNADKVLHGFLAILQCVHAERYPDQETRFSLQKVHPSAIKILATGKGNSKKDKMMAAYEAKFGMPPVDSDECDAVWLLMYAEGE